jgi:hypothetical protein
MRRGGLISLVTVFGAATLGAALALAAPVGTAPLGGPAPVAQNASANPSAHGGPQTPASANPPAHGGPQTPASANPSAHGGPSLCREQLIEGKDRPKLTERFPASAPAGHVAWLEVTVEHGAGEAVMPGGVRIQKDSEELRLLEQSGFIVPDPEGPARPSVTRQELGTKVTTQVRIPFVPLPQKPTATSLTLPALPLTLARANGEQLTVCTAPHSANITDVTANVPNATPKPNPPLLRQLEEWTSLKHGLAIGLLALLLGGLFALLWLWWRNRERRPKPAPPPRPPWEVALDELAQVRRDELIAQGRFAEHFARVSDTLRKYLGARFGFDGLESTTAETLRHLGRAKLDATTFSTIDTFFGEADLVKFARRTPTEADCVLALSRAETTVHDTLPAPEPPLVPEANVDREEAR